MICVKDIDVIETEKDELELFAYNHTPYTVFDDPGPAAISVKYARELIHGHRYINSFGKEVRIGLSKKVQNAIGLPLEAFQNLTKRCDNLQHEAKKYCEKFDQLTRENGQLTRENGQLALTISNFLGMSLWERIKFLFLKKYRPKQTLG